MRRGKSKGKQIKKGSFVATLYPAKRTIAGRVYRYFRLCYVEPGGRRVVRDFAEESDATKAAAEASKAFALGRPDALAWSRSELVELDAAAKALEGTGVGVYEAVQGFLATATKTLPQRTVAQVVQEMHADRKNAGCSEEHVRDITKRLDPFAKAFACQIASVTPPLVRNYLADLRGRNGQPLTARSRDNARRMIVSLFNFARQQRYIPRELAEEMAELPAPKLETVATEVFTPEAMRTILKAAEGPDLALLAIGAFCGVRTAELHRLTWEDIRFGERVLVIGADRAKTASRRVIPIPDNLAEWLAPFANAKGQISPYSHEHALSWGLMKIARRAGVEWVKNGLRHSFCSYRLAVTKNAATVAHEAGNSPAVIHRHYAALNTEAEGKAWFDIRPATPANVIALPATK
ncbi:MAG: tyrosine-type recombinase/integrase [Verrucomicrobia bacterium]|nr:tyrosine-type recombinase/integrase [Verrucomicrobiota bacterium]